MKSQDGSKIVQQLYAGVLTVACITTFPLAGQSAADDRLAAARAAIRAMNFDSAASLLRQTLESTGRPSHDERLEAWLLLGVVQFYQGDDSGTAADFRQALELEPRLQAQGLAKYDSALVVLFEAQRVVAAPSATPRQAEEVVLDCTASCPRNVVRPRLLELPSGAGLPLDGFDIRYNLESRLTVRFIVDTTGFVLPGSVRVVSSTMQLKNVERDFVTSLHQARFVPARTAGARPARVLMQLKVEFKGLRRTAVVGL